MRQIYATKKEHLELFCCDLLAMEIPEFGIHIEIKTGQRTLRQNNAIYKYFQLLSDALNDAGLEIHMEYLGKSIEVPWTSHSVKTRLWLPIMEASYGITSTKKLTRSQVSKVYEVLARHMSENHSISVPFPQQRYPE